MRFSLAMLVALGGCDDTPAKAADAPVNQGSDAPVTPDAPECQATPPPLPACANPVSGSTVQMQPRWSVGASAVLVTAPINDPRQFIVTRQGAIRIVENGTLRTAPFLDLDNVITSSGSEQGLLGLAFHPAYACNGRFYVYYTTNNANVVAVCTVSVSDRNDANDTCTPILSVPDFASNHNGGMIEFGNDGYLYIGTGDGGNFGDPQRTAQNPNSLLGKILRIDVDTTSPGKMYGIPASNPYASGGGAPEVFMRGLRNPWRWSFDKQTYDLWIGDVGQDRTEELTVLRAGEQVGRNLGWSIYEGNACCDTQDDNCAQVGTQYPCDPTGLVFPQETRTHADNWLSIIAGEVYRGTCYPDLVGWFFYTDHSSAGRGLHKARLMANGTLEVVDLNTTLANGAASLHADAHGELYMTTIGGAVYHLEAGP